MTRRSAATTLVPRALVDTHTWLWMLADPDRLTPRVRTVVDDPTVEVLLSAASVWEIAIKYELGKLPLPEPPESFVPSRLRLSGCTGLNIDHLDALQAGQLPALHRDPFDRLLVAQAQLRDLPLVTCDAAMDGYDVEVLWE